MRVHRNLDSLPPIPFPVVTMGSFDGVHAGHRAIIGRLRHLACQAGGSSVLVTFHPHPRKVLYPEGAGKDLKLISTLDERCILLEDAGLDHLVVMDFSREFAMTSPEDYVREVLLERLKAHTIVVGFNHFFGHNKKGDFKALYRMSRRYGFHVEEIPEQEIQHETVSSTKIRKALREGHIQRANAYLEHQFLILATLDPYKGCFRIRISESDKLIPPEGAYAASFRIRDGYQKSLVLVADRELLLYPLSEQNITAGTQIAILFQKHLANQSMGNLERGMEEVEELIF